MVNAVRKLIKRISDRPAARTMVQEVSGVREMPHMGEGIYIADNDIKVVSCLNETDMMVKLSTVCPFLSHKDYQQEVSDYLFSHFDEVFTFHPITGKVTRFSR